MVDIRSARGWRKNGGRDGCAVDGSLWVSGQTRRRRARGLWCRCRATNARISSFCLAPLERLGSCSKGLRVGHREVVVASVPDGEYLDRVENPRSMLRELMRVFRAMDERGLAMVEFDEKSVLATSEGCV